MCLVFKNSITKCIFFYVELGWVWLALPLLRWKEKNLVPSISTCILFQSQLKTKIEENGDLHINNSTTLYYFQLQFFLKRHLMEHFEDNGAARRNEFQDIPLQHEKCFKIFHNKFVDDLKSFSFREQACMLI